MLAPEAEALPRHGQLEHVEALLGDLAVEPVRLRRRRVVVRADRDPPGGKRQHLAGDCAAPDAKDAAAAAEVVQQREVLGEPERMPLPHDVEHRPDPQPGRAGGQEGREHQAVRHHLVAFMLEVVLGEPEAVVAELL